jgi:hypothetical protein
MAEDRIDDLIDEKAIKAEFDFAKNQVKELLALIKEVKQKGMIDMSGVKNIGEYQKLKKDLDLLTAAIDGNVDATKRMIQSRRQESAALDETQKLKAKIAAAESDEAKNKAFYNRQLQDSNKLLKLEAELENTVSGSVEESKAKIALLTFQKEKLNLTTEYGRKKLAEYNLELEKHNALLDLAKGKSASSTTPVVPVGTRQPVENIPFVIDTTDIDNMKKMGTVVNETELAEAELANASTAMGNSSAVAAEKTEVAAASTIVYRDALEAVTGTLAENVAIQNVVQAELNQVNIDIKNLDITSKTYSRDLETLTLRQAALKAEMASLNLTIKNQTTLENAAVGSLDALNARLNLLNQAYTKLGATAQASPLGLGLKTEIQTLNTAIVAQETALGRAQKSVGNYAGAITNTVGKTFGALRKIAYIIPGLGLAGLIGFLFEGISKLTSAIFNMQRPLSDMERHQKVISEISIAAAKSVGESAGKLVAYKDKLNDLNLSQGERIKFAKEYNKTADKTNQIDLKQIDNLELINVKLEAQNKLIIARAISLAATAKLGEAATKFVDLQLKVAQATQGVSEDIVYNAVKGVFVQREALGQAAEGNRVYVQSLENLDKQISKTFGSVKKAIGLKELIEDKNKAKAELEDLGKLLTPLITTEKPGKESGNVGATKDFADDLAKIRAEITKLDFEALRQRRQDEINSSAEIIADKEKSYSERFRATQNFYQKSKELIELNTEYEKKAANDAINEEERKYIIQLSKPKLTVKQKSDLVNILIELENKRAKAIEKINTDSASTVEKIERESGEKIKGINADVIKSTEELTKAQDAHRRSQEDTKIKDIQNTYDQQLADLDDNYARQIRIDRKNKRKLIEDEQLYSKEKIRIQFERDVKILEEQIRFAEAQLEIEKENAKNEEDPIKQRADYDLIASLEKELAALKIKLNNTVAAFNKALSAERKKISEEEKAQIISDFEEIRDKAQSIFSVIGGFINASVTKELNGIQDQIDLLDKKKQKDIEVVNSGIGTAQQKADAIAIIEARTQAQHDLLEIKKRQAQERQARFEKAASIASIILNTAVSISKVLGNPLQVAFAAALGAAQLAVALATQIPKYKYGTNDHPGGLAEVGHGKTELVVLPTGELFETGSEPRVMDLPKHTVVYPDSKAMVNHSIAHKIEHSADNTNTMVVASINSMKRDVVKAIKGQPQTILKTDARWKKFMKTGSNIKEYI